jgi:hypothetical protein
MTKAQIIEVINAMLEDEIQEYVLRERLFLLSRLQHDENDIKNERVYTNVQTEEEITGNVHNYRVRNSPQRFDGDQRIHNA